LVGVKKKANVTFRLDSDLKERAEWAAGVKDVTLSKVFREALRRLIRDASVTEKEREIQWREDRLRARLERLETQEPVLEGMIKARSDKSSVVVGKKSVQVSQGVVLQKGERLDQTDFPVKLGRSERRAYEKTLRKGGGKT